MERKKALIAAASATLVLATSGAAIAANLSLLGDDGGDVGQLDAESVTSLVSDAEPTTTSTTVPGSQVIVVDEWVTDPAAPATGSVDPNTAGVDLSGDGLPDDNPTPGSSSDDNSSSDDDSYDDSYEDESEDDESEDDEHEDDSYEDGEDAHEDDD